jgi:hypothetical protein
VTYLSLYIADKIKMINNDLLKGLDNKDLESLEAVKVPMNQLFDHIRESIQGHMRENIKELIKKLRKDKQITGEDLRTIQKWMVGDAEYYTKIETNFQDWVKECKRLSNILAGYTSEKSVEDESSLFTLNALLVDLRFTLEDVIRYVDFSNRVKQFMDSINSGKISKEDKKILADLIEQQLYSEEF